MGTQALASVSAALRQVDSKKIMAVPNGDAIYFSGRVAPSNVTLVSSIDANATYASQLSLLPPYTIFLDEPTVQLTTFQRLLKKEVYSYAIISVAADAASELDTLAFRMGEALAADLRKDPTRVVSYSVELYGAYASDAELDALLITLANQRPQPEVLVLAIPTYNSTRVQAVLTSMANAKVDPKSIIWMFPIDNPEEIQPSSLRKQFKYQTWISFWGDELHVDGGRAYLGTALSFR